jgi:hypothetical protein
MRDIVIQFLLTFKVVREVFANPVFLNRHISASITQYIVFCLVKSKRAMQLGWWYVIVNHASNDG